MKFPWFKRKNAQAVEDKDKGTVKLNAVDVFVDVNGKKVSVAELEKYMLAEEAEQAALAAAEVEPMAAMDESFVASNGKEYKIADMVNAYTKRTNSEAVDKEKEEFVKAEAKAKADAAAALESATRKNSEDAAAKEKAEKEAKEKAEKENAPKTPEEIEAEKKAKEEKKNAILNAIDPDDEKSVEEGKGKLKEEGMSEDEIAKELTVKKEGIENKKLNAKNLESFARINSLRETAEGAEDHGVESMNTKLNRGKERYGSKKSE